MLQQLEEAGLQELKWLHQEAGVQALEPPADIDTLDESDGNH